MYFIPEKTKISIVTPTYNQAEFLEETINSVLSQNYRNLEYIIIDGGSTDKTVEIIKKYEKYIFYWISERDEGQSHALYKGFNKTTGEILNWLNSDDLLAENALEFINELYLKNNKPQIIAAATENFDSLSNKIISKSIPENLNLKSILNISKKKTIRHQPRIFFKKQIYNSIGRVNKKYHICMDLDLYARMLSLNPSVFYSSRTVAYFRHHDKSKTQMGDFTNTYKSVVEYMEIAQNISHLLNIKPNHLLHVKTTMAMVVMSVKAFNLIWFFKSLNLLLKILIKSV